MAAWDHPLDDLTVSPSPLGVMDEGIYLLTPPTGLHRHIQSPAGLPFCVPPSLRREQGSTGILTSCPSPTPFGLGLGSFNPLRTLPYHTSLEVSVASVRCLSPGNFRRHTTRPVSCYAFFKGWLLLSQPPGCLSNLTTFTTEQRFRDLSGRSGFFPSRP